MRPNACRICVIKRGSSNSLSAERRISARVRRSRERHTLGRTFAGQLLHFGDERGQVRQQSRGDWEYRQVCNRRKNKLRTVAFEGVLQRHERVRASDLVPLQA